ncbi:MAG TPA: MBG domain-containing protein, partial [Candidatus Paceibacterota bacterium]|nr:MBG domain-containing protein [Candidatus Paceibacterota bacterium]
GAGFTTGTYTLMSYTGTLSGTLPTLGSVPAGYTCSFDTNTVGLVKLVVASDTLPLPDTPTNLGAVAANQVVNLRWHSANNASSYKVKRGLASGGPYPIVFSGITTTNYTDTQVTNGTTYFYVVSGVNGAGEGAISTEVAATPQTTASSVVTSNVFDDVFSTSTLNSKTSAAPDGTSASYELISSKAWNPAPSCSAGHLKFGISPTTSGCIEVQGLFAGSPVTLATIGDNISLVVTFTNTSGLLTQAGAMGFGLYCGGTNPVAGGLNGVATTSYTTNAIGNAQTWAGYVGQLAFTNAASQILTRLPQTGPGNNNQDAVTTGSGSSSYTAPPGTTVGSASAASSVVLTAGGVYTEVLSITLTATNTLAITNFLYAGTDTNGTLLSQFGGIASGATYVTNSFDALAVGWRATTNTSATAIDINKITVNITLSMETTVATAVVTLHNLSQTYDGTARSVTASTIPPGLSVLLTYDGSANAPTNIGSYTVVGTVSDANYVGGATNTLVIGPSLAPPNIVTTILSGQLQISWPPDHLGWRLQIQTNTLSSGLGTNWVTVPDSETVTATNLVISLANGGVFLRLVYP